MQKLSINTIEEFNLCISKGVNPLFWHRTIKIEINLRKTIQQKLFGNAERISRDIVRANDRYYHYCFEHSLLACENCGVSLYAAKNIDKSFSAIYVSHIISKGSNPQIAHDPRNHNILCPKCHDRWENGTRREMLIYFDNSVIIHELKNDYY